MDKQRPDSDPLHFLDKLLRPDARPALQHFVKGTLSGPLVVELDPTTACNYSCPECISADLLNQDSIPGDRLKSLIRELHMSGVQAIILIGGGEPLAHKAMPSPIIDATNLGIAVGLTTNGSLIDRHLDVIAERVSWTRVSMDAATEETYGIVRPNKIRDAFQKVVDNMRSLAEKKRGLLGYSFLLIQRFAPNQLVQIGGSPSDLLFSNASELYSAACLARDIGCDYFEFKPMVDMGHHLVPIHSTVVDVIKQQWEQMMELSTDRFRIIAPSSLAHLLAASPQLQEKHYTTCPTMEFRTVVTPSGVFPCPYHRGRTDKQLGILDNTAFGTLWNSKDLRARARQVDPSVDCSFFCIRHEMNLMLEAIRAAERQGLPLLKYLTAQDVSDPFI